MNNKDAKSAENAFVYGVGGVAPFFSPRESTRGERACSLVAIKMPSKARIVVGGPKGGLCDPGSELLQQLLNNTWYLVVVWIGKREKRKATSGMENEK